MSRAWAPVLVSCMFGGPHFLHLDMNESTLMENTNEFVLKKSISSVVSGIDYIDAFHRTITLLLVVVMVVIYFTYSVL